MLVIRSRLFPSFLREPTIKAPIPELIVTACIYWTTSCTVVLPLVPRILSEKVPVEVDELLLIVNVDVPWPVPELGLKVAMELVGNPRTRNVTSPLKLLMVDTVTV